jgi:hypothetical protein
VTLISVMAGDRRTVLPATGFLSDFSTDVCVVGPNGKVPVRVLGEAYKQWCDDQGEEPAQGRTFNRMMEERGFERKQARVGRENGKAWVGIRLKNHQEIASVRDSSDGMRISMIPIRQVQVRQMSEAVGRAKTG